MARQLRNVAAIMNPKVTLVSPDTVVDEAARLMAENHITYVVVMDNGEPVGVCSERDLVNKVVAKGLPPTQTRCAEVMTTPAYTIRDDANLEQAYEEMEERWSRRLVVTDASGALVGLITQSDLISGLYEEVQDMLVENERLHEAALAKEALAEQARIARRIQTQMLPDAVPLCDAFEFAGANIQAHEIGGDFFDFVPLDEDTTGVLIADVVGNGIPAALLMVMTRSILRAAAVEHHSPRGVLQTANIAFLTEGMPGQFVTAYYCMMRHDRPELVVGNAGHLPLMIWRQETGQVDRVDTDGLPLGVRKDEEYDEISICLNPGDVGLLYTDGLMEVKGADGEMLGLTRLSEMFRSFAELPADEILEKLLAAVDDFAADDEKMDDRTLVAFRALE